ncbi:MAG: metallophosphoesterase [Myxococcota bacterium]
MLRALFFSIFLGLHGYLAARLVGPLGLDVVPKTLLYGLFAALALPYPIVFRLRFRGGAHGPWLDHIMHALYVQMGLTGMLFALVAARDLLWLVALLIDVVLGALELPPLLPTDPEARRGVLVDSNIVVLVLLVLGSVVGSREARRTPRVKRVTVPIAHLPRALEGFAIAHLTDLHIGPTIKQAFVRRVVDVVNALQADAVALTGDIVDASLAEARDDAAALGELRARHGVFYVTGNHEYYHGAEPWVSFLVAQGLRVLLNEHDVLEHEGAQLVMAGICDFSAGSFVPSHRSDPVKALAAAPAEAPRVLLAHQPRSGALVEQAGPVSLMLSGHTHGGQMWPWNLFVPLQQPLLAGLHRAFGTWVYVSRGTGYWGPPFRLGAPSEVALLTLTRAA